MIASKVLSTFSPIFYVWCDMKWLIPLILFFTHVYADNEVRVNASCKVTIFSDTATNKVQLEVAPRNLNQVDSNANIIVTTSTVTKTTAELAAAKKASINFKIQAVPNPSATTGYVVYVDTYSQRVNLDVRSAEFQNPQLLMLTSAATTSPLIGSFLYAGNDAKVWFRLPLGVRYAPSWQNDRALYSTTSSKSSDKKTITFTLELSKTAIDNAAVGVYWYELLLSMDPYDASAAEESTNDSVSTDTQINNINMLIDQIDGYLSGKNTINLPTTSEKVILNANKATLNAELVDL